MRRKTNALSDIERLRKYYINDSASQRLLDEKENEIRSLLKASAIKDFPEVRVLIDDAEKRISEINSILLQNHKLPIEERYALFYERDAHEFWISRFTGVANERKLKALEAYLSNQVRLSTDGE